MLNFQGAASNGNHGKLTHFMYLHWLPLEIVPSICKRIALAELIYTVDDIAILSQKNEELHWNKRIVNSLIQGDSRT